MRIVAWLLRLTVFVLLLALAAKNGGIVEVKFFFGARWQLPFNLVMLGFFAVGAAVGVVAALGSVVRQRREISRLRREAREADALLAHNPRPGP